MPDTGSMSIPQEYLEFLTKTGLPFGSPMVYVPPAVAGEYQTENFAAGNYHMIERAIREGLQVEAHYKGRHRLFCPHVLGYSSKGNLNVLAYQFGGASVSKSITAGSPDNWRCFSVDGLEIDGLSEGAWHSAPMFMVKNRPQPHVVHVLAETEHERARHRDQIDPATGEVSRAPDNLWSGGRSAYGASTPPDPPAPPPHLIAALGDVHPGLTDLTHSFNRGSYRVVYRGETGDEGPDFSGLPVFNTLSVRLPGGAWRQRAAFDAAMRFIEARNPWVFILESSSRVSEEFRSHVWAEAWLSDFTVKEAAAHDSGGNLIHVLIGSRGAYEEENYGR